MYRRILVPLDGTRFGDHALPYAVDLAKRTGAGIELVHVHHHHERDPDLLVMPQYRYQHVEDADRRYGAEALEAERRALEKRAGDIELRYGVPVATRILEGRTNDALLHEAQEILADMIVMASHARLGLPRMRYGCLAHDLITQLNVPALCIRPDDAGAPLAGGELRRFLIPLDGSEFSEQILDPLAPLLKKLGAEPTLLHVITPRPMLGTGFTASRPPILNREQAMQYLNQVAQRFRGQMPEPMLAALEDAQPATVVASLMSAGEYDAVAMATHGRSGLSRFFLGSVAEEALHATNKPVLLYRPRAHRVPDTTEPAEQAIGESQ